MKKSVLCVSLIFSTLSVHADVLQSNNRQDEIALCEAKAISQVLHSGLGLGSNKLINRVNPITVTKADSSYDEGSKSVLVVMTTNQYDADGNIIVGLRSAICKDSKLQD